MNNNLAIGKVAVIVSIEGAGNPNVRVDRLRRLPIVKTA